MTDHEVIRRCAARTLPDPDSGWTHNRILGALCRTILDHQHRMETPMVTYTVIGAYPGGTIEGRAGTFCHSMQGPNMEEAVIDVQRWAAESACCEPDGILILSVFEGHLMDQWKEGR